MGEVIYIFYSYVFGLYLFSLTTMTAEHNHGCNQKDRFILFYYVQSHIYQICTLWTEIKGYHPTRLVWRNQIIFHFFLYVDILHLTLIGEGAGIC